MMIRARKDWEHLPGREACLSGKNLNTVNKKGKYQNHGDGKGWCLILWTAVTCLKEAIKN